MIGKKVTVAELVTDLYDVKDRPYSLPEFQEAIVFLGCCYTMINKTKSQCFQDIWVLYENQKPGSGFFVEFGATDGLFISNTLLLEKEFGWHGILCEPNPNLISKIKENRNAIVVNKCVDAESGNSVDLILTENPECSVMSKYDKLNSGGEIVSVETISLYDLLEQNNAPNFIEYLSVDTEGNEYEILKSFFDNPKNSKYNIKCITVEVNNRGHEIFDLLSKHGYQIKFQECSRWDSFYVKDDKKFRLNII